MRRDPSHWMYLGEFRVGPLRAVSKEVVSSFECGGCGSVLGIEQAEETGERHTQRFREFDGFEIAHPTGAALDPRDGEAIDVPTLPLATRRQFLLREIGLPAKAADVFAHEIFSARFQARWRADPTATEPRRVCPNEHEMGEGALARSGFGFGVPDFGLAERVASIHGRGRWVGWTVGSQAPDGRELEHLGLNGGHGILGEKGRTLVFGPNNEACLSTVKRPHAVLPRAAAPPFTSRRRRVRRRCGQYPG